MKRKKTIILFAAAALSLVVLILPAAVFGQNAVIPPEGVDLALFPEIPGPESDVRASVSSFLVDLNDSNISWYVNGALLESGVAKKEIRFKTGRAGTLVTVRALVTASDGRSVSKEISFRPAAVDLVYESADSYTPPFYKGKALPSDEGMVKVVAVPHIISSGSELPSSALVFSWRKDGKAFANLSGVGRNQIVFRLPKLTDRSEVEVEVSTLDKKAKAAGEITVSSRNPEVLVYENHPLFGILFNKTVSGERALDEKETGLAAYPLYFSASSISDGRLLYDWRINGRSVGENSNSIILRAPEESGVSAVSVSVGNKNQVLQSATASFRISFGTGSAANPFF